MAVTLKPVGEANSNSGLDYSGGGTIVWMGLVDDDGTYAYKYVKGIPHFGQIEIVCTSFATAISPRVTEISNITYQYKFVGILPDSGRTILARLTHLGTAEADVSLVDGETKTPQFSHSVHPSTGNPLTVSDVDTNVLYQLYADTGGDSVIRGYYAWRVVTYVPVIPADVTTLAATDITLSSALLNGEIGDYGGECTERGFKYYKDGDSGNVITINEEGDFENGEFSLALGGLLSGTKYYFKAYALNSAGTSEGSYLSFTTESVIPVVTTQAATQIGYQSAMGNGTIVSGTNVIERGFEIKVEVDYFGVGGDIWWGLIGFSDEGDIVYSAGQRTGYLIKRETETGTFSAGTFAIVLGYADILGAPSAVFNDGLMKCESYTYRAYATNDVGTGYGAWVAFDTLCAGAPTTDDISEGNPTVPIIPIEAIEPIELVYPEFVWEIPEWDLPEFPPWFLPDLPDWEFPDYPSMSFVGDFYYRRPYTKKDLDDLRKKCIIYSKNSVEFALVLRHNMNVLREFFNMMTTYLGKDEFNDFTDLIPPQRLKELYLDPLELNDFKDMINEFIRNTVNNNMAVNRNFKLIEEGTADDQTNNEEGTFKEINSNIKTVTEDNPDAERLKRVIDNLNQEVSFNFGNIMHNLKIVRARLL